MKTSPLSFAPVDTRQDYREPALTEYGSVTALTQESSAMGLIVVASVTATVLGVLHS
jgi:hypothetical protein